jgi:DNA processing protein
LISETTVATVALAEDAKIDPCLQALLVLHFGTPVNVLEQLPDSLTAIPQLSLARAERIVAVRERLLEVRLRLEQYDARGIRVISFFDAGYPESLRRIADPPSCLYVRGSVPSSDRRVAVMGAALASADGIAEAVAVGKELARLDVGVVSGLTGSISGGAHLGCLAAGGTPCAVVDSGLDYAYLQEFEALAAQIVSAGAMLSEHPPSAGVSRACEGAGDRIILGLSQALVVIEPELESPHMAVLTKAALREGEPVFVSTREPSDALSRLVRLGAYPLRAPEDVETLLKLV